MSGGIELVRTEPTPIQSKHTVVTGTFVSWNWGEYTGSTAVSASSIRYGPVGRMGPGVQTKDGPDRSTARVS
jgi:hypothetical protein